MSEISVAGGGGLEEAGKLQASEVKSLDNLGDAKEGDMSKFNNLMGEGVGKAGNGNNNTLENLRGPYEEMPSTRVKTDMGMGKKERVGGASEGGLGSKLMDDVGKFIDHSKKDEARLMDILKESQANGGHLSSATVFELQYITNNLQMYSELFSKGMNKTVTALQTLVRNQ